MTDTVSFHALVPAAGTGSRMGGDMPKQYLSLLGRPVIAHTLDALLRVPRLASVCVVLSPGDTWWERYAWPDDRRLRVLRSGGATRAASVAQGLAVLAGETSAKDWVLVHDAARACLAPEQVDHMLDELREDPIGGLLAMPLADTLKRADAAGRVDATLPRAGLWQAQTPQMFRIGLLADALRAYPDVTDEAGAIEAAGHAPRLIESGGANFKITYPQDLALAASILASRKEPRE
ncbi:2-C-methyl-D-erythritol 4-phosphate cytidylyltransferase [Niveibacterium sp. SC-1]|uniref:2-C-methyl-D-erythritol 4-phosphate cytidylyltransferase n=1 Tax=Niveibacterium sp. SC-1 TaxID=3135646 RepID=UPI00311EBABB